MFGGKQRGVTGILLLAFVLRVAWIWVEQLDSRPGRVFDAAFYHISALQIAAGNGLVRLDGSPTAEWPPGYPLLLGGLYAVTGESIPAGKLLNAVLKKQLHRPIESVEFLSTIQNPEVQGNKQSIVDVLCKDKDGCRYIREMQVFRTDGFKERAQYYASKAFIS